MVIIKEIRVDSKGRMYTSDKKLLRHVNEEVPVKVYYNSKLVYSGLVTVKYQNLAGYRSGRIYLSLGSKYANKRVTVVIEVNNDNSSAEEELTVADEEEKLRMYLGFYD